MWKTPGGVGPGYRVEVLLRVRDERLGNEKAGVVDQGVHASEATLCRSDDLLRRCAVPDVASDRHDVLVAGVRDRSRSGNHAKPEFAVARDQTLSDTP